MTKDEALKLALDALTKLTDAFLDTEGRHGDYERQALDQGNKALASLQEALAQEQWTPEDMTYRPGGLAQPEQTHSQNPKFTMDEWAAHARKHQWRFDEEPVTGVTTLAQPEHPAQMARLGWQYVECPACKSEGARAFPKPEQEPVAWGMAQPDGDILDVISPEEHARLEGGYTVPLYLNPPNKEAKAESQRTGQPYFWQLDAIKSAINMERENCARLCDAYELPDVAQAIRARGHL